MRYVYDADLNALLSALFYVSLGYAVPSILMWLRLREDMRLPRRRIVSAVVLSSSVVSCVPTLAMAAPWYEREPFVTPVSYLFGAIAMAGAAWITGLFAQGKKLDIENANRELARRAELELEALMQKAIQAIEERASAHPKMFDSKLKRSEALVLFRKMLPYNVSVPHDRAEILLDSMLVRSGLGAKSKDFH